MRRLTLAAVVAAAVMSAAGCGSDDTSESATTEWADGVCSALSTWSQELGSTADGLKEAGTSISKDDLSAAADDVRTATETLGDDLRGLGRPDTEAGQTAQDTLTQLADDLSAEVETITTAVDEASGLSGAITAFQTVSSTLAEMGSQVASALSTLESLDGGQELEDAFAQAPACADLQGGS